MTINRKKHSTQTKVKVVLDVLKGEKTRAEITAKYGIHATQINNMLEAFEQQSYHLHAETLLSQGIDYLKAFPELDEYTIEAADGHFIDHACHTEKTARGKFMRPGGFTR
ncbi:transposase [Bathymodiolus japonicus methanotrophic gill symbiont]|uniref:transposase n=1 Tax=Bathymodiolus japonicus methanotrophic gill symbiont TaxID=113269 RepID=UPI001C8F1CF8|nr:transposase [Bathymodiolus japonicus methanotrophic gill symbiont]